MIRMRDEFFMAIFLFLILVSAVFGVGASVYGICVAAEWWIRLLCWFGSIICLVGAVFIIWVIKALYFDEE